MSRMPKIGITSYYVKSYEFNGSKPRGLDDQDMIMSSVDYSRSIAEAGGLPVVVPTINCVDYIKNIAKELDGFLFTGGPDVNPLRYNQRAIRKLGHVVPERDEFEFNLLNEVLSLNKPVFAICRGFQLVNIHFGGTLIQDLANTTPYTHSAEMFPRFEKIHKVNLEVGSIVAKAYECTELWTNSFHHQAVDKPGEGLLITGHSDDGIIEAYEHPGYKFLAGVQWHPEMMSCVHKEHIKIFKALVDKAK